MKKVLVIAMLFCGMAQMAEFERILDSDPDRDFGTPIIKITKENIIGSIKESCFENRDIYAGGESHSIVCSFRPTTIQETLWGGKEEVAFYYSDSYVVSFIEVERILENLSTFKVPQNTQLSIYQNMIKTTVQDIYKDIQKAYNNKDMMYGDFYYEEPVFFELVKHYKTLTTKYANTPITQAMINPLKTSAQQKYQALVKLENQRRKLEEQQREEIESRSEVKALRAKIHSLYDKKQELEKLYRDGKIEYKKYVEEFDLIRKEMEELSNKIPEPQGTPELDAQISSKKIELSLLVQEIRFLEMQREIQKVEQMSKAQLTQYVIQHSVCNNKQLKEEEECLGEGLHSSECAICVDAEEVTNLAKRGLYKPGFMFSPTELHIVGIHRHSCMSEDEEGNRWSGFFDGCDWKRIIINRTLTLNDIAQALKENDMPKLLQSLRYFEHFAKNKERDFISQLIKHIKHTYKIDDGYRD